MTAGTLIKFIKNLRTSAIEFSAGFLGCYMSSSRLAAISHSFKFPSIYVRRQSIFTFICRIQVGVVIQTYSLWASKVCWWSAGKVTSQSKRPKRFVPFSSLDGKALRKFHHCKSSYYNVLQESIQILLDMTNI